MNKNFLNSLIFRLNIVSLHSILIHMKKQSSGGTSDLIPTDENKSFCNSALRYARSPSIQQSWN